jgi:hypothetical protein
MVESWVGLLIEFCERLPWNCLEGLDRESKGIRWFYLLMQTDLYHGTRTRVSDMASGCGMSWRRAVSDPWVCIPSTHHRGERLLLSSRSLILSMFEGLG